MLKRFKLAFILMLLPALMLANEDELLPPEQAFELQANLNDDQTLMLNWSIAEGYYLYREKLKLQLNGTDIHYSELNLPQGQPVDDPLFGEVIIYKNALEFELPVNTNSAQTQLTVTSQGCYEPLGICYPPQTRDFNLIAQAQADDTNRVAKSGIFSQGTVFGTNTDEEFLPVDEAFQFVLTKTDTNRIVANFEAAPGYYLYKPHIKFNSDNPDIVISQIEYPTGVVKEDPHFGEIEVYYGNATIPIELSRLKSTNALSLTTEYQGCAEDGICYPPQTRNIELTLADYNGPFNDAQGVNTQADKKLEKSILWYLLAAFGGGLLLTFTPCVLPMIPILSGIIMTERGKGGVNHSGLLSIIYVLGTAASYTLIGAVAGASGEQLQAYFQTPLAIGLLSGLLVLMALSMFGLFKIQVPAFMQSSLSDQSQKLAKGGVVSIFAMGMFSALIVGACVSPLLISTLGIAIAKGSALLGAALMFFMAMGMGVVLVFFGFNFGHFVPKAGAWMNHVNKIIGLLLLAVAIYLLSFIPAVPVLFLWSILLIASAVYLFSNPLTELFRGMKLVTKTLSIICLCWGLLALVGGLNGFRDIMNPVPLKQLLAGNQGAAIKQISESKFTVVTSLEEVKSLMDVASKENKLLMLDYYADWCLDCLRMDGTTFKEPSVVNALQENFILVKVDVTDAASESVQQVKKYFNVYGPPATLFFSPHGNELVEHKFYGYRNTEDFLVILDNVVNQS